MKAFMFLLSIVFSTAVFAASSQPVYVSVGYTQAGTSIPVANNSQFAALVGISSIGLASGAFTCTVSDICTRAGHDLITGMPVEVSSTSTLPTNISAATTYYAIKLSDSTFSLSPTLVSAQAGSAIDITGAGSGTHTIGGVSLAGASIKLQGSMDGTNWVDLPIKASGDATKSANITATGNLYLSEDFLKVNYVRVYYTLTSGGLNVSETYKIRGINIW